MGKSHDYVRIFSTLKAAGVQAFLPVFQYVEQPNAKTLGFERDFLAPCTASSPVFSALRQSGLQLVIAADMIYPRGSALPSLASDPLRQILACAGRVNVYAVLSYDEPVQQGAQEAEVKQVFDRVKAVDATLPVLMVHAPLISDHPRFATSSSRSDYLQAVVRYSRYADVVGFDVYPIPREIAKVTTPDSDGAVVDYSGAIPGYMAWLRRAVPNKQYFIVLQGFSYVDQFDPAFLATIADPATIAAVNAPNPDEIAEMTRLAAEGGAGLVFWWGPSLVHDVDAEPWPAMMSVMQSLKPSP